MKRLLLLILPLILYIGFQVDFKKSSFSSPCPFCSQEILSTHAFYRENGAIALLTHKPAVPGHVLIIPERHVTRFEELKKGEIEAIGEVIKKVDLAVRKLYQTTGYDLLQKNGSEAGQSVPHVHFHYLPRSSEMSQATFLIRFFLRPYFKPLNSSEMSERSAQLHEFFDPAALD